MKLSWKMIAFQSKDYQNAVLLREEVLRKPLGLSFIRIWPSF
jgi:hypothetical protein